MYIAIAIRIMHMNIVPSCMYLPIYTYVCISILKI